MYAIVVIILLIISAAHHGSSSTKTSGPPLDCISADGLYDQMLAQGEDLVTGPDVGAWLVLETNCRTAGGHPKGIN